MTCAAVTVLMVYFLLCSENYNWQWRAFLAAGSTAGYIFLNAIIYWVMKLSLGGFAGSVLYIGYSALISFLVFILTGMFSPGCDEFGCSADVVLQDRLASLPAGCSCARSTLPSRSIRLGGQEKARRVWDWLLGGGCDLEFHVSTGTGGRIWRGVCIINSCNVPI
jgi:hypothetical protein